MFGLFPSDPLISPDNCDLRMKNQSNFPPFDLHDPIPTSRLCPIHYLYRPG